MSKEKLPKAGFEEPQKARDDQALGIWRKHGLGDHPSLREIEPKATELLGSPLSLIEGASMVLGRDVRSEETELIGNVLFAGDGRNRFGVLLLQRTIEQLESEKK